MVRTQYESEGKSRFLAALGMTMGLTCCGEEIEKQIPPPRRSARGAQNALRGPTRQTAARKRKSGRSGPFDFAQGRRDDNGGEIMDFGQEMKPQKRRQGAALQS